MQRALNRLTENIFSGIEVFDENKKSPTFRRSNWKQTYDLTSNLPLQISFYFNCCYFPFWLLTSVIALVLKYDYLHSLYRVILVTVLIVISLVEVVRLYLGYRGNLAEMIPELAGFWLLTLLLQLPLQSFLMFNEDAIILPLERAANIIMMAFIIFQLVVGYSAIKRVSEQLAVKFQLETFDIGKNDNGGAAAASASGS